MGEKGRERIEEERDGGKVGERDRGRGRRKGKESLRKKHSPICHLIFISNAYVIVHLESTELQNTHTHKKTEFCLQVRGAMKADSESTVLCRVSASVINFSFCTTKNVVVEQQHIQSEPKLNRTTLPYPHPQPHLLGPGLKTGNSYSLGHDNKLRQLFEHAVPIK